MKNGIRKLLNVVSAVFMAVSMLAVSLTSVKSEERTNAASKGELILMHRLYNPNSGEHFYTASEEEVANVVMAGWRNEGIGWIAPSTGDPVYRLYNANGGEHHYTLDVSEKDMLVNAGWRYEGIGWYSAPASTGEPLHREYNPNAFSCNHNYTLDVDEHNYLVSLGWHDEGIGWYGVGKDGMKKPLTIKSVEAFRDYDGACSENYSPAKDVQFMDAYAALDKDNKVYGGVIFTDTAGVRHRITMMEVGTYMITMYDQIVASGGTTEIGLFEYVNGADRHTYLVRINLYPEEVRSLLYQ